MAKGIMPPGTENLGGTTVTAGGLVFIGGTKDEKFHAFDKSTGKLLWDFKLDAGGYAPPRPYSIKNRQHLVIPPGGGGKPRTKNPPSLLVPRLTSPIISTNPAPHPSPTPTSH